jgi:hypothetical protein
VPAILRRLSARKRCGCFAGRSCRRHQKFSFAELATGKADSQRVAVHGIVRAVTAGSHGRIHLDLAMTEGRLRTLVSDASVAQALPLIDATVRVEGVCYSRFNRKRRLLASWLEVNRLADVFVEQSAPVPPPDIPINSLFQFPTQPDYRHRVKVRGVVTHQQLGQSLFISALNPEADKSVRFTGVVQSGS